MKKKPSSTIILLVVLLLSIALLVAFYALMMTNSVDLNLDKTSTLAGIIIIAVVFLLVIGIIIAQVKSEKKEQAEAEKEQAEAEKKEEPKKAEPEKEQAIKEAPPVEEEPAKEEQPAEEAKEEPVEEEKAEEYAPTEEEEEDVEELFAEAEAIEATNTVINKQFVYEYIKSQDYAEKVELNKRPNYNSANWPIPDAHYALGLSKQCFIMVYETKKPTVLIIWNSEEYANALKEEHPNVTVSKVPKAKIPYYKLIMDDTYTEDQVKQIIDDSFAYAYKIAEVTPPDEEPEEAPVEEAPTIVIPEKFQDDYIVENGIAYMIQRSFIVKVAGLDDIQKGFYSQVKNRFLSYKRVRSKISFRWEAFYLGRQLLAKFQVRGKSITAFFALDEKDLEGTKYRVQKVENSKAYEQVPYKFKFCSPRKTKYACEMADIVMSKKDTKLNPKFKETNWAKTLPSLRDKKKLLDEGLCKKVPTKKFMQ